MHPKVRRDFPRFGQLYHVDRRLVSPRSARSASERTFKFPDRRIARTPGRIERDAGAGLTAIAFNFHPAVTAIEALLSSAKVAPARSNPHTDRPCFGLGPISGADGLYSLFPCALGADFGAAEAATENDLA